MVTDLVHLGQIPGAPLSFDGAMIAAFAAVGLLLGLASVSLVHAVALRVFGRLLGWTALLPVLGLCSLGVLLGRFGRFEQLRDALVRPMRLGDLLAGRLADPYGNGRALAAALGYTVFLAWRMSFSTRCRASVSSSSRTSADDEQGVRRGARRGRGRAPARGARCRTTATRRASACGGVRIDDGRPRASLPRLDRGGGSGRAVRVRRRLGITARVQRAE